MTATDSAADLTLERPLSAASLTVFRISFGLLLAVMMLRFWAKGWIENYYLTPEFHFTYTGFDWIQPWPGLGLYLHVAVLIISALMIAAGIYTRLAAGLFFLGFSYLELLDKTPYLNHYYAIACLCFLLIWLPPVRLNSTVPAWGLYLLRIQISLIYLFAGLAKLNPDWLLRAEPLQRWLLSWSQLPLIGPYLAMPATAYAMSWAGLAFDLSIPIWLLWPRTRPWAYTVVVIFHLLTALLFPIGLFPWIMILLASLLLAPDWPLKILRPAQPISTDTSHQLNRPLKILLAVWLLLQVLIPMRHLLYGGNLLWHEQGFRFSWQVMVMEKTGLVEYLLDDPVSERQWRVQPSDGLTPFQVKMLSTQPDMIQQYAHELGRRWRAQGYPQIEVRAEAWAALNGRESRRLIDPDINLLTVPLSFWKPKSFILPLE